MKQLKRALRAFVVTMIFLGLAFHTFDNESVFWGGITMALLLVGAMFGVVAIACLLIPVLDWIIGD